MALANSSSSAVTGRQCASRMSSSPASSTRMAICAPVLNICRACTGFAAAVPTGKCGGARRRRSLHRASGPPAARPLVQKKKPARGLRQGRSNCRCYLPVLAGFACLQSAAPDGPEKYDPRNAKNNGNFARAGATFALHSTARGALSSTAIPGPPGVTAEYPQNSHLSPPLPPLYGENLPRAFHRDNAADAAAWPS